jgi:DNA-binding CsgD family transcriptional regulator
MVRRAAPRTDISKHALLGAVLDFLPCALIVLGQRERVLHASAAARALLASGQTLMLQGSRLRGAGVANDGALRRGLATLRTTDRALHGRPVGFALIAERGRRFQVIAAEIVNHVGGGPKAVALFISDPMQRARLDPHIIGEFFHLTRAEARLAVRLAAGDTLSAAASSLGVSVNTVRNQLRSLFNKTGVNRQTDLLRVLLGSVACVVAPRSWSDRTIANDARS